MVDAYFERDALSIKGSTRDRYQISARALAGTFGAVPIHEYSRGMVADYIARRRQAGVQDATIRRDLAALRVMLNAAVGWEWLDSNPLGRIRMRGLKEVQRTRFLSREEWDRLAAACDPDLRALCTLAVETGMRMGELLSLEWGDVSAARMEIAIRGGKTGSRTVPLSQAALDTLRGLPRASGLVFRREGPLGPEPLKVQRVSQRFALAAAKAKLRDVRFHDLRHTFASWKVQAGHDLYRIQRILGHKGPQMTQRYAQLRTEDLRSVVGTDGDTAATHLNKEKPVKSGKVRRSRARQ